MQSKQFSTSIGGKEIVAEFTDLAEQANGSVLLRYGNTAVLATATMSEKTRDDIDYFPLTVDYEERFYAAGAILGSRFQRREGRPSDDAILTGRIVDRTIRPLFPQHLRQEVQVVITILALDEEDPAVVAVNAASLALATSDIPWHGPVAAVRIGKLSGEELVINPTYKQREVCELDVLACGKDDTINMIEVAAKQVSEEWVAKGFTESAHAHGHIVSWQESIVKEIGKPKREITARELPEAITDIFVQTFAQKLSTELFSNRAGKKHLYAVKKEFLDAVTMNENLIQYKKQAEQYFEEKLDLEIHRGAIEGGVRPDGRAFDEIRSLYAKAGGVSSILHGSGIFYRGGTHVFTALTLGGPEDTQIVDTMEAQEEKKGFMHHYNFPPYSSGETGRMGGINRRAIGHGALAEKALLPVIPSKLLFPYTIRLVSECFASNGSTSMGSVCASTLALMDGGVPIVAPVAGMAIGLMMQTQKTDAGGETVQYKILTDIQGPEDSHGDMDFKVAGTKQGITAIQMDIKLDGIPVPILIEALVHAKEARLKVLNVIEEVIEKPRASISPRAPEIVTLKIKPEQIGLVIGSGGKTINTIRDTSGVQDITIEDDGLVFITGKNGSASKARDMVEALVKEYKAGEIYDGEVTRLMDFGAFVRIGPSKDAEGLVHVSEVAPFRILKVSDAIRVGDKVRVMIKEIDEKGRLNLSIKAADPDFATRRGLTPNGQPSRKPDQNSGSSSGHIASST